MEQNNDVLKAVTVILRSSQSIQEVIRKDAAHHGLNATEFSVLELLYHKGEQPIQLIGKKVLISSSSITYVVDKLEQKKYVRRRGCPEDRRVVYAVLTSKGQELMEEIFPKHIIKMENVFNELTNDEISQTIDLLKRIGLKAKNS